MDTPKKKDENEQAVQTWKYCKVIAILALICAIALLGYVLFAPSSPMMGGKKGWKMSGKKAWKMGGGCGCVATPQA